MYPVPTVFPASDFDADSDAAELRKALKGFGTDEATIIKILSNRSEYQRQRILKAYDKEGHLIKHLKKDLGGKFEQVVMALMTPLDEYLAEELHRAMDRAGTDENALIEILCTRNNESIREIKSAYKRLYDEHLKHAIKHDTCDDFKKLLVELCDCDREEGSPREDIAPELAKKLYKAGEGREGTDEDEIMRILTNYSFSTLRLVFDIYRREAGKTLGEVMEDELEGDFKRGMLAVYNSIHNTHSFFAEAIHNCLAGIGTHDHTLIRLIVSRCEIDMDNIKHEYKIIYNNSLGKDIKGDTSGHYEDMLLALIKE